LWIIHSFFYGERCAIATSATHKTQQSCAWVTLHHAWEKRKDYAGSESTIYMNMNKAKTPAQDPRQQQKYG